MKRISLEGRTGRDRDSVRHAPPVWVACWLGLALACGNPAPEAATPPATKSREVTAPATLPLEIPNETWKTRRVDAGGYSIRFPPDASVTIGEAPSTLLIGLKTTFPIEGKEETIGHSFDVRVHPNEKGQSSTEWAVERLIDPAPDFVREREDLLVDGLPAYRVGLFGGDQLNQHVVVARAGSIYELAWDDWISIMPEASVEECSRVHEAMVASFRFVDGPP